MNSLYNIILELTSQQDFDRTRCLNDFAYELGWRPGDHLYLTHVEDIATAHILVEHGLENTAVISFIKSPRQYSNLDARDRTRLTSISYNNLVDWHINIDAKAVSFVFNRIAPLKIIEWQELSPDDTDILKSDSFEQITGKRPNPNLPALDDALISAISSWKIKLSAELNNEIPSENLSTLFNTIIFIRAIQDHRLRSGGRNREFAYEKLIDIWKETNSSLKETLIDTLKSLTNDKTPDFIGDESQLTIFDNLDKETVTSLLEDFYQSKRVPYPYDFSLISKHALSRIYEHYVSLLTIKDSSQGTFRFTSQLPEEESMKSYGSYYTPQFIARFFARYLREQTPPIHFKNLKVLDPACGSGIFLRTILEFQCNPVEATSEMIKRAFGNVFGIDRELTAVHATQLSLSLLHLVLTDDLPENLNIKAKEAIKYFSDSPEMTSSFNAIIANPPFVSWDNINNYLRTQLTEYMGKTASGRIDLNLAFLKIALEALKPGGFGFFVLPHSFLLKESSKGIRDLISEKCWINCLVDLSAIPVFDDAGTYTILLIFQKKPGYVEDERRAPAPPVTIMRCIDFISQALQDLVEGKLTQNESYQIYQLPQTAFHEDKWQPVPPLEFALRRKLNQNTKIQDFLTVREGMITGADDIFIRLPQNIPPAENLIYKPFLPDREMLTYSTPDKPPRYVFYPYIEGVKIQEDQLREEFPKTWKFLSKHKEKLSSRRSIVNSSKKWWEPISPRKPIFILRPKIISPHLVLVPHFSLDINVGYTVSRSPFIHVKEFENKEQEVPEIDLLKYFLAILNSSACFWHISNTSHKYRRGYTMLEPRTLNPTPVTDPEYVKPSVLARIIYLINQRLNTDGKEALELEKELDCIIADLYRLTSAEKIIVGIE